MTVIRELLIAQFSRWDKIASVFFISSSGLFGTLFSVAIINKPFLYTLQFIRNWDNKSHVMLPGSTA